MSQVPLAIVQADPDLKGLDPEFHGRVLKLIAGAYERGVVMIPVCGIRTVFDQAKAYRQSRSGAAIAAEAAKLRAQGAPFLAEALLSVGPQKGALGAHVTKALPGLSWHQWGLAVDLAWSVDGKILWDLEKRVNGQNGYKATAELADDYGVFSGGKMWGWDFPHFQAQSAGSPKGLHTMPAIDEAMRRKYG
jgi:peptidoglycan L-alanyl-D-glutamate endopeptidase CwlK